MIVIEIMVMMMTAVVTKNLKRKKKECFLNQVKDVRLPQSLQRAMAAEAEAAREARAKVVMMLMVMFVVMMTKMMTVTVMSMIMPMLMKMVMALGQEKVMARIDITTLVLIE